MGRERVGFDVGGFYASLRENQGRWRELVRGPLSRPVEFPKPITRGLDRAVKIAFQDFIQPQHPEPVVTWSVLFDHPWSPQPAWFEATIPEAVSVPDQAVYRLGIWAPNDWITHLGTKYLVESFPGAGALGYLFSPLYGVRAILLQETEKDMRKLAARGRSEGHALEPILFEAYFRHPPETLNQLIQRTEGLGADNLTELAIAEGQRYQRYWGGRLIQNFMNQDIDGQTGQLLRRISSSFFAQGRNASPGVVELALAAPLALSWLPFPGYPVGPAAAVNSFIMIYALAHELTHYYSQSGEYNGLIPVRMVGHPAYAKDGTVQM